MYDGSAITFVAIYLDAAAAADTKNQEQTSRAVPHPFAPSADGSPLTSFIPSQHTNDMYNKYTPRYLVSIYTSLRRLTLSALSPPPPPGAVYYTPSSADAARRLSAVNLSRNP